MVHRHRARSLEHVLTIRQNHKREMALHAVVSCRFPLIIPEDTEPPDGYVRDPYDDAYQTEPQYHPYYAAMMSTGPLPLLEFACGVPALLNRIAAAKELPGLLTRLQELSLRTERTFAKAAALAKNCLQLMQAHPGIAAAHAQQNAANGSSSSSDGAGGKQRKCAWCESESLNKLRCGGCRAAFYCNRECQLSHWKAGHKADCKQQQQKSTE